MVSEAQKKPISHCMTVSQVLYARIIEKTLVCICHSEYEHYE